MWIIMNCKRRNRTDAAKDFRDGEHLNDYGAVK